MVRLVFSALVLAVSGFGCIFIFPPIEAEDHCQIAGATDCAQCIRNECQGQVDQCCSDTVCGSEFLPTMKEIDSCGTGDTAACAKTLATPSYGRQEDLRSCVAGRCGTRCTSPGQVAWSCESPRNEAGACARCIYDACRAALDSCCEDSTCKRDSDVEADMRACVGGDEPGCAYLLTKDTNGLDGVLRACITRACGKTCMGDGRPHASCEVYAGGQYCACNDAIRSSGPACTKGTCVVGKRGCECGTYECEKTSSGCSCNFRGEAVGSTSCLPTDTATRCCLKLRDTGVGCTCERFNTRCDADLDEYDVASCEQTVVEEALRSAGRLTTSCSR